MIWPESTPIELCGCPEARAFRERLAHEAAARLRQTSHAVADAADWTAYAGLPTFAELADRRSTYAAPPMTPEQIAASTRWSWQQAERKRKGAA